MRNLQKIKENEFVAFRYSLVLLNSVATICKINQVLVVKGAMINWGKGICEIRAMAHQGISNWGAR